MNTACAFHLDRYRVHLEIARLIRSSIYAWLCLTTLCVICQRLGQYTYLKVGEAIATAGCCIAHNLLLVLTVDMLSCSMVLPWKDETFYLILHIVCIQTAQDINAVKSWALLTLLQRAVQLPKNCWSLADPHLYEDADCRDTQVMNLWGWMPLSSVFEWCTSSW